MYNYWYVENEISNLYVSWLCGVIVEYGVVIRWRVFEGEIGCMEGAKCARPTTKQYLCDEHGRSQLQLNIWIRIACSSRTPCINVFIFSKSKVVDISGRETKGIVWRRNSSQRCQSSVQRQKYSTCLTAYEIRLNLIEYTCSFCRFLTQTFMTLSLSLWNSKGNRQQ